MLAILSISTAAGIASHVFWFRHGEHHMQAPRYAQLFVASLLSSMIGLSQLGHLSLATAALTTSVIAFGFLLGAFSSVLVFRLFLAPICTFPGPWQARVSTVWFMSTTGPTRCYHRLQGLHEKYGRYVRIGSNELSITDPAIMELAYGVNAKATKAEWYDGSHPFDSMHTTRDKPLHDRRRRVWGRDMQECDAWRLRVLIM